MILNSCLNQLIISLLINETTSCLIANFAQEIAWGWGLKPSQGSTLSKRNIFYTQSCSYFKLQDKRDFQLKIQDLYFSQITGYFSQIPFKRFQFEKNKIIKKTHVAWLNIRILFNQLFCFRNSPCPETHHKLSVPAANPQTNPDQAQDRQATVPIQLEQCEQREKQNSFVGNGSQDSLG